MSSSDIKREKLLAGRSAIIYVSVALFCALFSAVYEYYSHGVYSNYMVYLFMFPLLGGVLPFSCIGLIKPLRFPLSAAKRLYNSGVASLTVGSCVRGVLDIYGTSSDYVLVYWILGALMMGLGLALYLLGPRQKHRPV